MMFSQLFVLLSTSAILTHGSSHQRPYKFDALKYFKQRFIDIKENEDLFDDEKYDYLEPSNTVYKQKHPNKLIELLKEPSNIHDITGVINQNVLRYDVALDQAGKFHLYWDISEVEETITFQIKCRMDRADVFGFGFSDYGEYDNADFFVLWTSRDGRHYATDTYTDNDDVLHVDHSQDYSLEGMDVLDGVVTITFSRGFDTCDDNDYIIDPSTTHILYFTSPGRIDDIEGINVTSYNPGLQRVQLLKSQLPDPLLPDDTQTFVMNVKNVHIPAQETTYWCSVQKLPELTSKHHIIKFEGHISEAGLKVVHHMEVFHCDLPVGAPIRQYNAPCRIFGAERPKGLESCRQVIGAWAMGAPPLTYPEEAGYAVGGRGFNSYVMLEVHYNNPEKKAGIVDSSGIKFYVTRQLREHDAGIMELGLEYSDKYAIPPSHQLWDFNGHCIPKCTGVGLPHTGIQVFASQLHTHLTGKRAFTKHYRQGIELPELNRDSHYSPHYQEIRKLHRQVTVLPGDYLVTTCLDSTLDRKNITLGGFAITDEMCVNYIHYYPKAELEVCKSSVTTDALYGFFNFLNKYQWEQTSIEMGISDNWRSIEWSPMNVELLHTFMKMAPLSMQCNQSNGERFPGEWENQVTPKILQPLPEEERPCLT